MSRPIPIKSPREAATVGRGSSRGISQSLPVPNSPHLGSLKAPPEFLTEMAPLALPASLQDSEKAMNLMKGTMARSAPAADLAPLHRYRLEEKRKPRTGSVAGSLGTSLKSSSLMASSLITGMNSLRLDDTIEEGEEMPTPEPERGVVLKSLQTTLGIAPTTEDMEELALSSENDNGEEEELQFELS